MKIRIGMAILGLVLFSGLAFHLTQRPWTQDESLYISVPKMMRVEHRLPYRDFIYPQMPLYPLTMVAWQSIFGFGIVANRLLSLLALGALCVLLARRSMGHFGSALLILSNPFTWDYFILVKPHAISIFFVVYGLFFLLRSHPFLSGICMGVATMIRHLFAPLYLLPILYLLFQKEGRQWKGKELGKFGFGALIMTVPALLALLFEPSRFLFNIFQIHASKNLGQNRFDFIPVFRQIGDTLQNPAHLAFLITFIVSLSLLVTRYRKRIFLQPSIYFWLGATFLSLLPSLFLRPFYDEYLALMVPFISIFLSEALFHLEPAPRLKKILTGCATVTLAIGLFFTSKHFFVSYVVQNERPKPKNALSEVRAVGNRIAQLTDPDDLVISFWSGYTLEANRRLPVGFETGLHIIEMAGALSPEAAKDQHLLTPAQVIALLKDHKAKVVVVGLASPPGFEEEVKKHYRFFEQVGGANLYVL